MRAPGRRRLPRTLQPRGERALRQLPRPRGPGLSRAGLLAVVAGLLGPAPARASDLAGEWKHVQERQTFTIAAWGPECGPRPEDFGGKAKGTVEVTASGDKVAFKKKGWKFGTHACLSRNPEIHFRGHDAGTGATTCSTAPGNAKTEEGRYTLVRVGDDTLRYDGSTRYDWTLKGSTCKATMKEVHVFERVVATPPPPEPVAAAPPPPTPAEPPPQPEPVAADEVVEEVVDAVTGAVTHRRRKRSDGLILDLGGASDQGGAGGLGGLADERHQVATASARRGAGLALAIVLGALAVALFAGSFLVVSRRRRSGRDPGTAGQGGARGGAAPGGDPDGAGRRTHGSDAGMAGAPADPTSPAGGALAVALPDAQAALHRPGPAPPPAPAGAAVQADARMRCPKCLREFVDLSERFCPFDASPLQRAAAAADEEGPAPAARVCCLQCLREYAVDAARRPEVCPHDGARLIPIFHVGAGVASAAEPASAAPHPRSDKRCPRCAGRYDDEATYCSKDGAELVSVN